MASESVHIDSVIQHQPKTAYCKLNVRAYERQKKMEGAKIAIFLLITHCVAIIYTFSKALCFRIMMTLISYIIPNIDCIKILNIIIIYEHFWKRI